MKATKMAWGRAPLESRAVLLIPVPAEDVGVGGFWVFDYVRDWADDVGADVDPRLHTVLEATWHFVVRQAVPTEALAIGLVAHKWGNFDAAKEAWTKAADSKLPRRYLEQPFA